LLDLHHLKKSDQLFGTIGWSAGKREHKAF